MKKVYIRPIAEFEETEEDIMLIGGSGHTSMTDYNDSPVLPDEEDYPGYKGEIDPDNPDPGFEFFF